MYMQVAVVYTRWHRVQTELKVASNASTALQTVMLTVMLIRLTPLYTRT
jgi:hypothetical protein